MNLNRIWALTLRHLYNFRHNLDNLADSFYWPAVDILLWGLTFNYIESSQVAIPKLVTMMLSALVFWQIVWRGQYEITRSFLEEVWNRNLTNLFVSPLTVGEWMMGVVFLGFFKMLFTVLFSASLAWFLYSVNIFSFGLLLIPFVASLIMMGWWVGFLFTSILIFFGQNLQTLAWSGVYLLFPFSAIYYPVSSLPLWAQKVASFVPASYIFEGMREVLATGKLNKDPLIISFLLNILFLVLSSLFFKLMFEKSRSKGLSRLEI